MCGFIAGQKSVNNFLRSNVERALTAISHRGPDEQNIVEVGDKAFLGHARLAIVGGANGKQPLHYNGIWAVVNGEFYDWQPIRKMLQARGFVFQTQSDSEIVLYLYVLYGRHCLDYLHGEFAFVLYDSNKNIWFAGRDRFGAKPLHWSPYKGSYLFASEAKALGEIMPLRLDKENVWFSQHFQYLPQSGTLFKDVHMLKPAHYLWIENQNLKECCYYSPPVKVRADVSNIKSDIEQLLERAVQKKVPSAVPACTHLSGGIDSSAVSYYAKRAGVEDCFTVSFTDNSFYDELPFARMTAKHLNMRLHVVETSFKDMLLALPNAVRHAEGLSINGHLGAKYILNKAISEAGFKVALTGEGADEIFMGYSHLKQDYLSSHNVSSMEKSYLSGFQLPSGKTFDLNEIEKKLGFVPTWLQAKSSIAVKLSQVWSEEFHFPSPNNRLLADMGQLPAYSHLKQSSFLWARYCLAGYILKVLDDAQSMAFSIEGRLPFLDTDLVNYVWSLPDHCYFSGNIEKSILRDIMRDKLPTAVVDKTKQSFMSPPLTASLKDKHNWGFIREALNNSHFLSQDIVNPTLLEKQLLSWQENGQAQDEAALMTLLTLALFCKEFKL